MSGYETSCLGTCRPKEGPFWLKMGTDFDHWFSTEPQERRNVTFLFFQLQMIHVGGEITKICHSS